MIDIHCHILDGLDDGADSLKESVEMVKIAQKSGTEIIVATPHCNVPDSYKNYMSNEIADKVRTLRAALEQSGIDVKILLGQEIFFTGRALALLKEGKLVTVNKSRYALVEFDFNEHRSSVYNKLEMLLSEGYKPIVAHPERYRFVKEDDEAAFRMKRMGCYLQINKGSVLGGFGRSVQTVSHRILKDRLADFVASDAHSPYMRTPYLTDVHEMICELYSDEYADFLLEDNPKAVIENKKIYSF